MANRRRNKLVVPEVDAFLNKFKNEIAAELGIANYDELDKGALPARVHGMIGGSMTKRLIELGQQSLLNGENATSNTSLDYQQYTQDMKNDLQDAIQNVPSIESTMNLH